jgi:hypothetical protein
MRPANKKIIVRVQMAQKDTMKLGDLIVRTATKYETNYREKSPVVAEVVEGNKIVRNGQIILCHHNHFYPPSPYYLDGDRFAIPANQTIFCIVHHDGGIHPVYGNMICKRVQIPSTIPLPPEQVKTYNDRVIVVNPGSTQYKAGDLLFHRVSASYDIVYNINKVENRITKLHEEWVIGFDRLAH